MIPTGFIAIDLAFIYPRHNPECARHPPDTSQIHSRHPTDTPKYGTFWPIRDNWEKRKQLLKICLNGCLSIACISYPSRQYPEPFRQPPDTFQTPYRHPKRHIFTHPRQLGERNQLIKISIIRFLPIAWRPPPTDSILSHPDNHQTPLRYPPVTLHTPQNMTHFDQSEVTGRKESSC